MPNPWLLVLLGLAIVALVAYQMWPTESAAPPATTSNRGRNTRAAANAGAAGPADLKVRLEALQVKRPDPVQVDRNPFRFKPPPAPPPPPKPPPVAVAPPQPVQPPAPVIPPIPLKFMGTIEKGNLKLAALTDCKGSTFYGKDGDQIDGRYRLVRIQNESVVMQYLNGTGMTTIRKSGDCPTVR
jgi:hypothetical protein